MHSIQDLRSPPVRICLTSELCEVFDPRSRSSGTSCPWMLCAPWSKPSWMLLRSLPQCRQRKLKPSLPSKQSPGRPRPPLMMMTPRHTLRDHPWNLSVISHESPRRLGSRADTWFCHVLQASLNDTVWCCMMLYDAVWCCMMLYDAVWCCMMLYDAMFCAVGILQFRKSVQNTGGFTHFVSPPPRTRWSCARRWRLWCESLWCFQAGSWKSPGLKWLEEDAAQELGPGHKLRHNHQDGSIAYDLWCLCINSDSVNLLFDACCVSSDLRI